MLDTTDTELPAASPREVVRAASQDFTHLLASADQVPASPRVVALMLDELKRPQLQRDRLVELAAHDPVTAGRLVGLAASEGSGTGDGIETVGHAIDALGKQQIEALLQFLAARCNRRVMGKLELPRLWDYSVRTAKAASVIAGLQKAAPGQRESLARTKLAAYTVGLLHAVGEAVLHLNLPQEMDVLDAREPIFSTSRYRHQRVILGYSYAQVSAALLRSWHVPESLVSAIEFHDAPFFSGVYDPLAYVLQMASWRARAAVSGLNHSELVASFPDAPAIALKIDLETLLAHDRPDPKLVRGRN